MGFNPPVPQQDSNWEIRVALLLSLLLQVLLIFLGPMRKRSASPISCFVIWSCYLLADWVADLGLGLILNNMGNIGGGSGGNSTDSSSPIIFAFWTPFLLLHLGGPDTITAYSLEDNELWLRHLVGLLFELFSAVVIIVCSVRGNRLILATTLMMVVGVIKYGERTYSLYRGSIKRFRSNVAGPPDPGPDYARLMTVFDCKKRCGVAEICMANGEAKEAYEEMEKLEAAHRASAGGKSLEWRAYQFFLIFQCLFVNLSMSLRNVRLSQALFLERADLGPSEAFGMIEMELNFVYDAMYTKSPVAHTRAGWVLRCICSCCLVSALVIFFFLDKPGHQIRRVDVGITYVLLLGGLALDVAALLMIFFSNRAKVYLEAPQRAWPLRWLASLRQAAKWWKTRRWSGKISQLNLITRSLGKPAHARCCLCLNKVADWLGIDDIVDDFVFIRRVWINKRDGESKFCSWLRGIGRRVREKLIKPLVPRCCNKAGVHEEDYETEELHLLDFIFDSLKGSAHKLEDKKHIMEVCSRRGKGVVDRLEKEIKMAFMDDEGVKQLANKVKAEVVGQQFNLIMDSVQQSDFDESLLLWHIATDLCMHRPDSCMHRPEPHPLLKNISRMQAISETLSEYMLYLLVKQPEMESARTGIWLMRYQDSCAEARRFFSSMAAWNPDHGDARMMLLSVDTMLKPLEVKGDKSKSVLFDAVILAKALRVLDEALMWEVIAGVWGEMLTYTASRCRGTTHVRLLNSGGELITLVWFLMANMGLGDMSQIQEGYPKAKLIVRDK